MSAKEVHKSKVDDGNTVVESESTTTSTDGLNTLDIGMIMGAGYQLENGLFFSARWARGFNSVIDYDNSIITINNSNSVIEVSVGYGIPIN